MDNVDIAKDISIEWKTIFKNYWDFKISYLKSLEHYNDWLFDGNSSLLEQDSLIIKQPEADEVVLYFGTSPIKSWSLNYEFK